MKFLGGETPFFKKTSLLSRKNLLFKMIHEMNSERFFSITVFDAKKTRLDRFLSEALRDGAVSREKIKAAIRGGSCTINGQICTDSARKVAPGENIILRLAGTEERIVPEQGEIRIVYQDQDLLVLNKASGLTVHPAPSCPEGTLIHRLLSRFPELNRMGGLRPGIVHRIDKDTSGLLCVALNEKARLKLVESFAQRDVHKEYLALVRGVPPTAGGTITAPIGRHPTSKIKMAVTPAGKEARTDWRILRTGQGGRYSLLGVCIHTGRTHQIRVHMAHLRHPLLGDGVYGSGEKNGQVNAGRQMLHAWKLELPHPANGERLRFFCPPPEDFLQTALALEKVMQRVVVTSVAGCGKSAFMHFVAEKDIPVWSADQAVIRLYQPGQAGWRALRERYGHRFINPLTSEIDRKALARALLPVPVRSGACSLDHHDETGHMEEPIRTEELENLIHPLVFADLGIFWAECEARGVPLAVAEVPLWFESRRKGLSDPSYFVVGLSCPEKERKRRLLEVRGWTPELMAHMDAQQWPQARKMAACNHVIPNDSTLEALRERTDRFLAFMAERDTQREKDFVREWKNLVGQWQSE